MLDNNQIRRLVSSSANCSKLNHKIVEILVNCVIMKTLRYLPPDGDGEALSDLPQRPWRQAEHRVRLPSPAFEQFDTDKEQGCIRDVPHAYCPDGGLAVLYGNIASKGCIVKTAGVDKASFHFSGKAKVFEVAGGACSAILTDEIKASDVVVIRYEGPRGEPGMQRCSIPRLTSSPSGWGRRAPSSRTGASPAEPPGCPSAMSRPRRRQAGAHRRDPGR